MAQVAAPNWKELPGEEAVKNPNIAFIVERSKNKNIVVYEGLVKDGKIDPAKPLDVYWLDIDPVNVKNNRAKGQKHDRSELGMIESKMAYGAKAVPVAGKENVYKVSLVALPSREVFLTTDASGKVRATTQINKTESLLHKIFVSSTERMIGLPKVNFIEIFGKTVADNKDISEKVHP